MRNGKIIALDGRQYNDGTPQRFYQAEDGKRYGYARGMTELFDPDTGETKVLTRMPFVFYQFGAPNSRQMQAIELEDGRIFMVGRFQENRPKSADSQEPRDCTKENEWHYLPIYSKVKPGMQLKSIAPCTERDMFGLIYDWRNSTFEVVNVPERLPPRFMVTMNLLRDGRVLIIGGAISFAGHERYESWRYFPEIRVLTFNPQKNHFAVVGNLQHARYGHETVPLSDTEFMMIGGFGPSETEAKETFTNLYGLQEHYSRTRDVEIFDLKTSHSRVVGRTLEGRYDFSAIPLPDAKILIHGGAVDSLTGHSASELFDVKTGKTVYVGQKRSPEQLKKGPSYQGDEPYYLPGEGICFRSVRNGNSVLMAGADMAVIYNSQQFTDVKPLTQHVSDKLLMPREDHHLISTPGKGASVEDQHLAIKPNDRVFVMGGRSYGYAPGGIRDLGYASLIEEFVYPAKAALDTVLAAIKKRGFPGEEPACREIAYRNR